MNPFRGCQQSDLEQWLADSREELATGKTTIEFGAADTTGKFQPFRSIPPERRIELLWAELARIDPTHYDASVMTRVRVTTTRFYDL